MSFKLSKVKLSARVVKIFLWDMREQCFTLKIRIGITCNHDQSSLTLVSSGIVYYNTHADFFLSFHLMSSGLTPNTYTCSEVYKTNGASFFQRQWHFQK